MQSIHGSFAIHRTQTVDGRNAILLIPNPVDEFPLNFSMDDERGEGAEIYFGNVQGGEFPPDSYLTLVFSEEYSIDLAPYVPLVGTT
jgi:hypothetical protein